jgi:hypothetical protein
MDDCQPAAPPPASETSEFTTLYLSSRHRDPLLTTPAVHSQSPLQEPGRPRPTTPESSVADTKLSSADPAGGFAIPPIPHWPFLTSTGSPAACAPSQEPVVEQYSRPAIAERTSTVPPASGMPESSNRNTGAAVQHVGSLSPPPVVTSTSPYHFFELLSSLPYIAVHRTAHACRPLIALSICRCSADRE